MANFTTHIAVGTVVAGGLATLTLAADVVAPENLVAVTMAGVLGSVLPDIDLKDSRPSRPCSPGLACSSRSPCCSTSRPSIPIAELWILWLGTLVVVRYGLHAVFHRLSVHRGIWHSMLAALLFGRRDRDRLQLRARPPRGRGLARRRLHVHRLPRRI